MNGTGEWTKAGTSVLFLCFFMHMIARGMSETIAVFLLPVTQDMNWSRTEFTTIYAVFMITHGVTAPLAGALSDRLGAGFVYKLALTILAGGFFLASQMEHLWQAQLGLGVMVGMAVSGLGMAVATGLISRWFRDNITLATSIAYAGVSVGMLSVAPLAQILIESQGWRETYFILALPPILVLPILFLLPWKQINGGTSGLEAATARHFLMPKHVLAQPTFWGLFMSFYATSVAIWTTALQVVAYLIEIGFSAITAATSFGVIGAMSIFGMLGTGFLADRFGRKLVVTCSFLTTILGVVMIWSLSAHPSTFMLFVSVVIFGLTMGSRGPVISSLVARLYPNMVGAVYGTVTIAFGLGAATGGILSGFLRDTTGGYDAVFMASIIACVLGLMPYWLLHTLAHGAWPSGKDASS